MGEMGKVTSILYAAIYGVMGGMVVGLALSSSTLVWGLWGLAVGMLAAMCTVGPHLDARFGGAAVAVETVTIQKSDVEARQAQPGRRAA